MTGTDSALRVLGIDNVLFAVGDLARATHFYEDLLGLNRRFSMEEMGIALFALGDEEPGLLVRAQDVPEAGSRANAAKIWLEVTDARASARELTRRGVAHGEPFEVFTGWTVEVADPWGNVLGFTDYTKDPARGRGHSTSSR